MGEVVALEIVKKEMDGYTYYNGDGAEKILADEGSKLEPYKEKIKGELAIMFSNTFLKEPLAFFMSSGNKKENPGVSQLKLNVPCITLDTLTG